MIASRAAALLFLALSPAAWAQGGRRAVDPGEPAEWDRAFAALAPIPGERVTLLVTPGEQGKPEMARLAAELNRAAVSMALRLGVQGVPPKPLAVVVEPDHVAQGRHSGEIGEAVPGRAGQKADLHLVWDSRDLGAYRYALARALISRAGLGGKSPPWLERGAALWLSETWYGRPWRDWLPLFAAAKALPTAAELLAGEDERDASAPLWTPAAALVVDRLPGATVAEKLARTPSQESVAAILARLAAAPIENRKSGLQNPSVPFLAGVSLAMLNRLETGYHAPVVGKQLDAFAALGSNAVSLMPFAFQRAPDRPEIAFLNHGPGSETDIGLIHATRLARARGFHVLYKPHLWISHGSWPGEVEMKTEDDWARWWQSYRRYVLHHAFLARWAGADLFSVGCELSKTVKREAEWRDLIAAVRLLYPGVVTYSGNWYGDLEGVRFWDALDLIGIDSYYPLSASPQATRAELDRGAQEIAKRFAAASRRAGRKILLTEVGFAAHRRAWLAPHTEGGEVSQDDQALAYQALFAALGRPKWLAGTFIWKAFSAPGSEGRSEADFRFQGRKAEGVIREYYSPHRER
ncbi:MAG TPA: hypothetical protein VLX28_11635 [Thermoanaerobaculia bacterium]|nr:hypothetical protein [Thermoanaerobaculia bacterium]